MTASTETADTRTLDNPEDRIAANASTKVTTSRSENTPLEDVVRGSPPTEPVPPALSPEAPTEVLLNAGLELSKGPKEVKDEIPVAPRLQPTLSFHDTGAPAPSPSGSSGKGNSQTIPEDALSRGDQNSTATFVDGENRSTPTTIPPDQKKGHQRKSSFDKPADLDSDPPRRRHSTRPNVTTAPTPARTSSRKSSWWESWSSTMTDPTPGAQKASTGPAWGTKPTGGTFGSGGIGRGSGIGSIFGSGVNENPPVDTTMKPPEGSQNAAGPEKSPHPTVEIKSVPVPGRFRATVEDEEDPEDVRDHPWGSGGTTRNKAVKNTKFASPTQGKEPVMSEATGFRKGQFNRADPVEKKSPVPTGGSSEYRFVWEGKVGSLPDPSWKASAS